MSMKVTSASRAGSGVGDPPSRQASPHESQSGFTPPAPESAAAHADQLYRHANLLVSQGRLDEAVEGYQQACRLRPDFVEALNAMALTFGLLGKHEESLATLNKALEIRHDDFGTLVNRSIPLLSLSRYDEAVATLERALEIRPDSAELCHNLGVLLKNQGKLPEAVASFLRALRLRPNFTKAYVNLGHTLLLNKQPEGAATCFREALRLETENAESHNALGFALASAGRYAEAVPSYLRALELKPDLDEAISNLGHAYALTGRVPEAVAQFQRLIAMRPDYAEAYSDMGLALERGWRYAEAVAYYDRALEMKPDSAVARTNRGFLLLKLGRYETGWADHEYRWRMPDVKPPEYPQPLWRGEPLEGRTILLCTEQGFGDTLHFIRYARLLKEQGASVFVRCKATLIPFLERLAIVDRVVDEEDDLPPFDTYCTLMSLPYILGTNEEASIPVDVPYLRADPDRVEFWREELEAYGGGKRELRVGISWQGNPAFRYDQFRSIPLRHFAPLGGLEGVRLFSLQRERGSEQLPEFARQCEVVDLGGRVDEANGTYVDRAAMIMNLDLVITSDTGLAHLAGGLGAPTWVALSALADWRWLEKREDSPWYPSARLFRRSRAGGWGALFEQIAEALRPIALDPGRRKDALRDLRVGAGA